MNKEKQSKILDILIHNNIGMSKFQIENYVINAQISPVRRIRQLFLELQSRLKSKDSVEIQLKRDRINKEMTLEKIEKSKSLNDDLHVKLLEVDLEEYDIGIRNGKNQLKHLDQEIKIFLDLVDEADKEYDIEKLAEGDIHNDVVERKYWIERMARQATLDLLERGSIGIGNMDSIINMDKEAQKEIFNLATGNYYQLKSGLEEAELNSLPMTELGSNTKMLLEGGEQLKLDRDILE